jgi:hypothetical protein
MVILFSRDSCKFLSISQLIFLILSSKWFLLVCICVSHVNFLSRCSPKYLIFCLIRIRELLMLTCGQITSLFTLNILLISYLFIFIYDLPSDLSATHNV